MVLDGVARMMTDGWSWLASEDDDGRNDSSSPRARSRRGIRPISPSRPRSKVHRSSAVGVLASSTTPIAQTPRPLRRRNHDGAPCISNVHLGNLQRESSMHLGELQREWSSCSSSAEVLPNKLAAGASSADAILRSMDLSLERRLQAFRGPSEDVDEQVKQDIGMGHVLEQWLRDSLRHTLGEVESMVSSAESRIMARLDAECLEQRRTLKSLNARVELLERRPESSAENARGKTVAFDFQRSLRPQVDNSWDTSSLSSDQQGKLSMSAVLRNFRNERYSKEKGEHCTNSIAHAAAVDSQIVRLSAVDGSASCSSISAMRDASPQREQGCDQNPDASEDYYTEASANDLGTSLTLFDASQFQREAGSCSTLTDAAEEAVTTRAEKSQLSHPGFGTVQQCRGEPAFLGTNDASATQLVPTDDLDTMDQPPEH